MRRLSAALALFLCLSVGDANAARRAFIVGIANYDDVGLVLDNGVRDASRIAAQLGSNFQVTNVPEKNTGRTKLLQAWDAFLKTIDPKANDDIVVYLSGHGIGILGSNYFVPKNIRTSDVNKDTDPRVAFIAFSHFINTLKARSPGGSAIWILDARRDNKFNFGNPKGLATGQQTSPGNQILYAAADGQESDGGPPESSGKKGNSLYTAVLIQGMQKFGKHDIGVLASSVQKRVHQLNNAQTPVTYGSLPVNWCFSGCDGALLQLVSLETSDKLVTATSTKQFALSKSLTHSERRQNAVFIGKKSAATDCEDSNFNKHPFGCQILRDLVSGNAKRYARTTLTSKYPVNVRKRAPIVRDKAAYFCVAGVLGKDAKVRTTGILSLKYQNDVYYWATIEGKREACVTGGDVNKV